MPAVRAAVAAVAFLTRVPVGRFVAVDRADVARAAALFPVVGAGIGAAVGGAADALAGPLSPQRAAVLGLALGTVLTGALHLDGLADCADALGAATRERALEIMRDHRIGAYGGAALVFAIAAKISCVAVLAAHGDALRLVACAVGVSRAVPVVLGTVLPYARPEGTGGFFLGAGRGAAAIAVGLASALCIAAHAWPLALVALGASVVLGTGARALLGGVTGDALGAATELSEVAGLVLAVALT